MSKAGLPHGIKMRHEAHYVDQIAARSRSVGRTISADLIYPNPEQPRSEFGDLSELTDSIREKGVLEPLLVKPDEEGRFMIIAGERRWRASKLAGLNELPCIEMNIDEQGVAEIALIENLQRKDLNVWEEADGLRALSDKFGYTQDEIAKKISKSRTTVNELMTVAGLPIDIRERCRNLKINSKATLLEVARQFDEPAMIEFLENFPSKKKTAVSARKPSENLVPQNREPLTRERPTAFEHRPQNARYTVTVNFDSWLKFNKPNTVEALRRVLEDVENGRTDLE